MSLDYPPTPHTTSNSRRVVDGISNLYDLHFDLEPIQSEAVAFVRFFSQERFQDNSEFIDELTNKMNQTQLLFDGSCGAFQSMPEVDMVLQSTRQATAEVRQYLETAPPHAETKRENILASWKEGAEPEVCMYEEHTKRTREEMDRQHKEADESLSYAKGVLTDTHELEKKKLKERFESSYELNATYVKKFSSKYQTLKELVEREERELSGL